MITHQENGSMWDPAGLVTVPKNQWKKEDVLKSQKDSAGKTPSSKPPSSSNPIKLPDRPAPP